MTLIKMLFALLILAFFAISFMTFDVASLNLDLPSPTWLRDNPVAVGVVGGFILMALIADSIVGNKHTS